MQKCQIAKLVKSTDQLSVASIYVEIEIQIGSELVTCYQQSTPKAGRTYKIFAIVGMIDIGRELFAPYS